MEKFQSIAIRASAGCGKTEDMGLRLLGMILYDGVHGGNFFRSSNTMTFTKAAAAEIYIRLLSLVYEALLSGGCDKLNARLATLELDLPNFERNDFVELLKKLLRNMSKIKISTIDSFMNGIVQNFPFELGLPGSCSLLDDGAKAKLKQKIILQLFRQSEASAVQEFIESCNLSVNSQTSSSYLSEVYELMEKIESIANNYQALQAYTMKLSNRELKARQETLTAIELKTCTEELGHIEKYLVSERRDMASLKDTLEFSLKAKLETIFPSAVLAILRRFFEIFEQFLDGSSAPEGFKRGWEFSPESREAIYKIMSLARDILVYQSGKRAQGILSIYQQYKELYQKEFYQRGYLCFDDLAKLLANEENEWTYDIAFRMNNSFHHWLIDEFQDTSRTQWKVLSKIIDEPTFEEERSVFIVGDVKQAIYAWRAGDRRLMGEVIERYQEAWNLHLLPKNESYRYGINICQSLNKIFGEKVLNNMALPEVMKVAWSEIFEEHRPAVIIKQKSEFECYLASKPKELSESDLYAEIIHNRLMLKGILDNNRSCAILVRSKTDGIRLKNSLQEFPELHDKVLWEGDESINSDRFIVGVCSLLIYLQHPGDLLNYQIVKMDTALRHLLPASASAFINLSEKLSNAPLYDVIKDFIVDLTKLSVAQDEYADEIRAYLNFENIEQLLNAARDFELVNPQHDMIEFREFVSSRKKSEAALGGKIRIMTVHHSKGLTFDFCFYIANGQKKLNDLEFGRARFLVTKDEKILYPAKVEMRTIEELSSALELQFNEDIFEEICVTYVAMTRAKFGMYLLLPSLNDKKRKKVEKGGLISETNESYYVSDFICDALNDEIFTNVSIKEDVAFSIYQNGQNFHVNELPKAKQVENFAPLKLEFDGGNFRRKRLVPSRLDEGEEDSQVAKKLYFELPKANSASELGNKVHEVFAQILDINSFNLSECSDYWTRKHIENCLNNVEIRQLLSIDKEENCWREKAFDCIINNSWVSGCFDRVNLYRNSTNEVIRAEIIDYKSSLIDEENHETKLKNYRRQLFSYRAVLAKMLNISSNDIDCYLIFSRYGKLEKL